MYYFLGGHSMVNKIISGVTALSLAAAALSFATSASAQPASPSPSATAQPTASANAGSASVRVIHASPDAPAVDVYVDDKRTLSSLSFKRVTGYLKLPAGRHSVKVYATTARGQGTPVTQQDVDLNNGWDYSLAVTGAVAAPQLRVFSDNLNLPGSGKTNLRVYHLAANAPAVNLAVRGGEVIARNLSSGNATDYLQLDSKSYTVEVQSATNSSVLATTTAALTANSVQSIFAFGGTTGQTAISTLTTIDRRGTGTPATGAEESFAFMALVAGMVAATGVALKKIALIQEKI